MDYSADLYKLTHDFIEDYPLSRYPELLCKLERPFSCLLVDIHLDYYICIPYRSSINHNDAFLFQGTERSKRSKSGLDYTKIILVKDVRYLDGNNVIVDRDEYRETMENLSDIVVGAVTYVDDYIAHITGVRKMHPRIFHKKYRYSTIPYFHDIMGI